MHALAASLALLAFAAPGIAGARDAEATLTAAAAEAVEAGVRAGSLELLCPPPPERPASVGPRSAALTGQVPPPPAVGVGASPAAGTSGAEGGSPLALTRRRSGGSAEAGLAALSAANALWRSEVIGG